VILTHPNADHVGGLTEVIDRFQVDRIFSAPVQHRSRHYRHFIEAVDQKNIKKEIAYAGKIFDLDPDITIHFLAPPVKPLENTVSDTDNNSVVVKVTCGEVSYLLMSDAQRAEEQTLLANPDLLGAQILKISQHGNADTTSDELLKVISPHWAVISVGEDNDYDYPNPETLRRLLEAGVRVLRTDLNGSIVLSTDGTHIQESIENNSY
jgi:beta-lactamase superfamily II metal-dependent hydrolase